jgi:iron complex outermembrane receptor protein
MNIRPLFAIVVAMSVSAQPAPPAGETTALEELLQTPISTAAKYDQRMSDVAASVTVITAEEIARYGWRTLAEVLSSIRGVYTTYDRAYTYLGVRGIGLPTDYNNRFLVLIDGVEMTESVSGSIGIDTTLAIDMSTVARIEFVRGPGSVLYGTGAMFGVINLITKDEAEQSSVTAGGGSAGLWTGAARVAITGADVRGAVALSWQDREGRDFYFPEFDSPETNHGIVRDRDGDRYRSVLATARWKDVRFLGLHSKRTKGIPTGAWSTTFGSDQEVTDARTLFAIDFTHRLDAGRTLFARVYDDRFDYHGNFPYEGNSFTDRTTTRRTGAELRYVWDLAPGQRLTTGVEYVDHRRSRHEWMDGADLYRIGAPFRTGSAYAQVESQLSRYVTLTAGASYDHSSAAGGQLTPRGALIVKPTSSSTMKLLYGRAFRSPSVYERDYYSVGFLLSSDLRPEEIRTLELVWEQKLTPSVLVTALVFDEDRPT